MVTFVHAMNATNNGQIGLYMNECANTYVFFLSENVFTGVSGTLSIITMFVFKKDMQEQSV